MSWTADERRLLRRGGWAIWGTLVAALVTLGLCVGLAGIVVASDEAFAARRVFAAAGTLLAGGLLVFVAGLVRALVAVVRESTVARRR